MVEYYRDIILENNMDFTDIIKFFNGNNFLLLCNEIILKWVCNHSNMTEEGDYHQLYFRANCF